MLFFYRWVRYMLTTTVSLILTTMNQINASDAWPSTSSFCWHQPSGGAGRQAGTTRRSVSYTHLTLPTNREVSDEMMRSGYDCLKSHVFRRWHKIVSDGADVVSYGSCRPAAVDDFSSRVSACVGAVSSWMKSNRLLLNCDKTEVLACGVPWVDVSINYRPMLCQSTVLL